MNGIILNKSMVNWEWYQDCNTFRLFIHLLLMANSQDTRLMGADVPRGTVCASLQILSAETGLSVQTIRTSLSKLQKSKEISVKSTSRFSLITISNYEAYRADGAEQATRQSTGNQQTETVVAKPKKERKKFVPPTVEEVADYCKERGNSVDADKFVNYYEAKGWLVGKTPMKDWKACVRTWEQNDWNKPKNTGKLNPSDRPTSESELAIMEAFING